MTSQIESSSQNEPESAAPSPPLFFLTTIILKWIWFSIRGANNPQMEKSEKFWDVMSINFDGQAKRFEENRIKTVENARRYLRASDIVLDYGCATGTIALDIAGQVKEVHGIDLSSKMIETAKNKAAERKIENVDFSQSTIFDERLHRESFDVVLALNILHFFEDTQQVTQRINYLLKPGGVLVSATPCLGEKKSLVNVLLSFLRHIGVFPYIRLLKASELVESIASGNLQIVETVSLNSAEDHYFVVAKKIWGT